MGVQRLQRLAVLASQVLGGAVGTAKDDGNGVLTAGQYAGFARRMATVRFDPRSINSYTRMIEGILSGRCPAVTASDAADLFLGMARSPHNSDPASLSYSQLQYFIGLTQVSAGDLPRGIEAFERSLRSRPGAGHAMLMAAHLATHGHHDEALRFSDIALRHFDEGAGGLLPAERVRREDILAFQEQVRADRDAAPGDGSEGA